MPSPEKPAGGAAGFRDSLGSKIKPMSSIFKAPQVFKGGDKGKAAAGNDPLPSPSSSQGKKADEAEKAALFAGSKVRDSLLNDDDEMEVDIDAQLDSVLGNIDVATEEVLFEDVDGLDLVLSSQEPPE